MIKTITAVKFTGDDFPKNPWGAGSSGQPVRVLTNRITDVQSGTPDFNGIIEAWWSDAASAEAHGAEVAAGDTLVFSALLEETVYTVHGNPENGPLPQGYQKVLCGYTLPSDVDHEEFWRYHTQDHGPDVVEAGGDLIVGYSLNRRTRTLAGEPPFFALIELWWASPAAADAYAERSSTYITASGKPPLEDYYSRGSIEEFMVTLDEK